MKTSKCFLLSSSVLALGMAPLNVYADPPPSHSWDYDVVLDGNVDKDLAAGHVTNIEVQNGNGFVEGNADIYSGHTVNVKGEDGATFAYRDNRSNIESTLNGNLNSNMRVVIIDKDGVFFGGDSKVDVQSVVATSAHVRVNDVMNGGDLKFRQVRKGGAVVNRGEITVAEAGLAAFVSPHIENHGVINAKVGNVVMASGKAVTLDLYGDGLVEVKVDGKLKDALIKNTGTINAQGGNVQITAKAAKHSLDTLINNTGVINASSAEARGGKIILSGGEDGTIRNNGQILTSAGGEITIQGERFVQGNVIDDVFDFIPSKKPEPKIASKGGDIKIETQNDVRIYEGTIDATQGGDILINNGGMFYSADENTILTDSGGTIELNQNQIPFVVELDIDLDEFFIGSFVVSSIQNAIDAVSNSGSGTNTINVGAGTYNEAVLVDHANMILNGANSSVSGFGPRGSETIVVPNSPGFHVVADHVVVNGFSILGGDPGIFVEGADHVSILNNIVNGSTTNGIEYFESDFGIVQGNWIKDFSDAGVYAFDSHNMVIGGDADVLGNRIERGHTGVELYKSNDTFIIGNHISELKGVGFFPDAINVDRSTNGTIQYNIISDIDDEGIFVRNARGHFVVQGNSIENVLGNGIEFLDSDAGATAEISENIITNAGLTGVLIKETNAGSHAFDVLDNTIDGVGESGINIDQGAKHVSGNVIDNAEEHGIIIQSSDGLELIENDVRNSFFHGLYIQGSDHGSVLLESNLFGNNGHLSEMAQARFEGGDIDISSLENPNFFVNTTDLPATAIQFDDITSTDDEFIGNGLRIVGETIGATSFIGYLPEGSFFVRFEDGSILDPVTGDPIEIDGLDASFEGFVPSSVGGILPPVVLEILEDRIYDADDIVFDERGQLFVGSTTAFGPTNFQDFLPNKGDAEGASTNRASVTINGLPRVGDFQSQAQGPSLNNISPAAGGNDQTPESLANIKPEAGTASGGQAPQEVTCLGDAVNSLSAGSVSYNFGGSFEESIASASDCATGTAL